MRKYSPFILILLTAFLLVVFSGIGSRSHHISAARDVNVNSESRYVGFVLTNTDCTLPASIEKTQQPYISHVTARQQQKRISETIFGHAAKCYTMHSVSRMVFISNNIIPNLETYDIGFPFSAFW